MIDSTVVRDALEIAEIAAEAAVRKLNCMHYPDSDIFGQELGFEGKGGILTDWQGQKPGLDYGGAVVAAAATELHEQLLTVLNGSTP